jgi:hypothetical protein
MDCYKEKAVGILSKFYMGNTDIPYQKRYTISKKDAIDYLEKMLVNSINDTEKQYYKSILFYLNKIKINEK